MKFETVRIHFLSEDFVAVAVEIASCFFLFCFVLFPDRHFFWSIVGEWHKLYAYVFLLVIFMENLFLFCVNRMLGMERSPFSPVMTTTMIQKAKI